MSEEKTHSESSSPTTSQASTKGFQWTSDKDLENEVRRLFSVIHNNLMHYEESRETKEILVNLAKVAKEFREYQDKKNAKALDEALNAAQSAGVKMQSMAPMHPTTTKDWISVLAYGGVLVAFGWLILHAIFGAIWTGGVFYLDLFFVAVFGALSSSMLYLGGRLSRVSWLETLTKLGASPFVAVVLVVLLSELTVGIGSELTTGIPSSIGTLTLRDATIELKLSFAFMFGFFGEMAVELLKSVMGQPATK